MRKVTVILIGLLIFAGAALAELPATNPRPPSLADTLQSQPAAVIPIRGEINDYSRDVFLRRLGKARALGAKVIIVQLDTPGGLVTSALDISRTIRGLRDLRTIAFIDNKAYSAGAMIALACDEVIMVPNPSTVPTRSSPSPPTPPCCSASPNRKPPASPLSPASEISTSSPHSTPAPAKPSSTFSTALSRVSFSSPSSSPASTRPCTPP